MTPKRRLRPLLLATTALLIWGNPNSTRASSIPPTVLPSPDKPIPSVMIDEAGSRRISSSASSSSANGPQHVRGRDPPGSPVNLFTPDEFQFYTLNGHGQLVMKQMTKQEIQSMIAAGGGGPTVGNLPVDLGHHQSSMTADAVPKVSDVVQNVQKVLKSELNKPVKVHTSGSSIPGSVNSQWTNMLPYILSGGSVDQQDVAQDTSIILPALDDDESYVDVVPLQGNKPMVNQYEPEVNYVQVQSTSNDQMVKPVSAKPTKGTSDKPINLLGNMALDSGIIGEQDPFTVPTKGKPSRPSSTPTYHKYTTTRPSVISVVKDVPKVSEKNSTGSKPTLYIPLSVSSSLLTDSEKQEEYSIPSYGFKPDISAESTSIAAPTKKTTTSYVYPDEASFTRVPMIQVPVISADKISTSTQRTNQQQTPMFEKLPTISPASITSTTVKETSYPSMMNLGPIGGFKKPETSYKPPTYQYPVYDPETKSSPTASTTTRHPVYEPATKPFKTPTSTTYHPVYRPATSPSTRRPVYEPSTRPTTLNFKPSFSRRPIFEATTAKASPALLEITTKPSSQTEGTRYPSGIYTTGKASTSAIEFATKPTIQAEEVKVTRYPDTTYQTQTTGKSSTPATESATKASQSSSTTQETTTRDEVKDLSPVYVVQQLLESDKYPAIPSASQSLDNSEAVKDSYGILEKLPTLNASDIDKNEGSTESYNTYDYDKHTVIYSDTSDKLPVKTTVFSEMDKDSEDMSYTVAPVKAETESDTPTTNYYATEKSTQPQPIDTVTSDQKKPLKTEESTVYEASSTVPLKSEEPSTEASVLKNKTVQTENTPIAETVTPKYEINSTRPASAEETKRPLGSEVNKDAPYVKVSQNEKTEESPTTVYVNEPEQTQSWSESEMTTQFVSIDEGVTEIQMIEHVSEKEMDKKPVTIEAVTKKQESTIKPIQDSTTLKTEYSELTTDYVAPINPIADSVKKEESSASSTTMENVNEPIQSVKKTTTIPLDATKEIIEKVTMTVEDKKPTTELVTDGITILDSEKEKPAEKEAAITLEADKITKPAYPDQTKLMTEAIITTSTEMNQADKNPPTEFPVYEKMETITESALDKQTEKINVDIDKQKIQPMEEEVSTVKVIPIYDDDTSIYTLISENPDRIKFADQAPTTIVPVAEKQEETKLIALPAKTTQYTKAPTITPSTPVQTTQSEPAQDTVLPGLEETFNNYIKEHYDPNLSSTGEDDEISHMTTFPPEIVKSSLSYNDGVPTWPTTISNYITTNKPNQYTGTELPNMQSSSFINAMETTENSKPDKREEPVATPFKDSPTTESLSDKNTPFTTKSPVTQDKSKVETPIIYLDLANSDANKQSVPPQPNKDFMSNSSLTRIKIKNPVMDIDKIISEAQAQTNTPSTVPYTLPSENRPANNFASGIIAGYPTYEQMKPVTEQILGTTLYEIVGGTKKPTLNVKPVQDKLVDSEQSESNISYQGKLTTALPVDDVKITEKLDFPSTMSSASDVGTTIYQASETPNYESYTQIPFESLPIASKPSAPSQPGEIYDPPLEKINDLINQLKNTPSEHASIGYDFSNGVETTIVPLDRFETLITESNPAPTDDTLTTIIEDLSKTSTESQNSTYVVIQTLPYSKPVLSSTEPTVRQTTIKEPTTAATTTTTAQNISKTKPSTSATTVLSIVKQPTTGKPYVTSTYSPTKGSIDKIQSTIDKSAGRINLEEEKNKMQQPIKPTEPTKFTIKNKYHYSTIRRGTSPGYQNYSRKTTKAPIKETAATAIPDRTTSKPIEDTKETSDKWTLIPQKGVEKVDEKPEVKKIPPASSKDGAQPINSQIVTLDHASGAIGLDQSNKALDEDVAEFLNMCNELSFKFWTLANSNLSSARSVTMSPFGMISTLAMIFLGARGLTSNQMNDILKLDDVVTFNPHLVFQNITDTVTLARGQGIENAAFVRALFADRLKVRRIIPFYKEQTQQFYEGAVVDINFSTAGDILRRRTNLLIRKQTGGRIKDFMKQHTVPLRSPLTALSANVFQTSCDGPDASSEGRDGEMYFAVSQTVKQRKLVPIPAVVWKSGVSAGYEPSLDATAVALGESKRPVSLIMVMPGQQGLTAPGDNLERLENRLFGNPSDNALEKLLKVIIPRRVELQMPKFSQRSIINVTSALKKMGFDQLFTRTADLKGINGAGHDLYLADMLQMNLFCTCGDENKPGGKHLSETYPGTPSRHNRAWEVLSNVDDNGVNDFAETRSSDNSEATEGCEEDETESWSGSNDSSNEEHDRMKGLRQKMHQKRLRWLTSPRRTRCRTRRQAEPEKPRMKMDKPFLYLIRHNLSGLILHIGRFNPKNQS
ncbi:hypothetical protein TSAR_011463 [Trichomalopsis sarcophagae]|uniref:Serpin domain-containing protein n=1 Tax=Trichomalopsis sarcophagae TaxID=543379 RepID=A0A232FCB8_9HYME|nr:hypothetical protein TSAR_011463 [Trichomalopsis sarcophagae]